MKYFSLLLTLSLICPLVTSPALALELPFIDNFEDGSATDGTPGNWVQGGTSGTQVVTDGSLVISADMANSPARLEGSLPAELTILSQVRFLASGNDSDMAALEARNTGSSFLFAGMQANGNLLIAERDANGFTVLNTGASSVDPRAMEMLVEFDLSGSNISLTAWEAGTSKPAPQVTAITSLPPTTGGIAAGISAPDGPASIAFRYVEAVPEPTTAALLCLSVLGLLSRRR